MTALKSILRSRLKNEGIPFSPQATASPSVMQGRKRRRASASTMSGKRPDGAGS